MAGFAGAQAQVAFTTSVKKGPVVVGESFRVQYVLEDDGHREFQAPAFAGFRFVSGPDVYEAQGYGADGVRKLKNIVYTLEAIKPGRFRIEGARARNGDGLIKSDDAWVEVITAAEAAKRGVKVAPAGNDAAYFLQPGEDPYRKIQDNLFLKVTVDKRSCFVGEAITATFKLYSRLMSKSDIVRNPGFYGFTVQDMIGLADKESSMETVNGKRFDVHTIRKVQLYPLRAGSFVIDPMEILSRVEFSRSAVNRQPEQEINEGVVAEPDRTGHLDTEVFESSMHSPQVAIAVKEPPVKNRPRDFAGATGRFRISAVIDHARLAKNEAATLIVTISGHGNFTQLGEPLIQWPAGIETFEPRVADSLDHTVTPLTGTRTFRFSFATAKPGLYTIPAIRFSFFDPDSNRYQAVTAPGLQITVSDKETPMAKLPVNGGQQRRNTTWIIVLFTAVIAAALGAGFWYRKRKEGPAGTPPANVQPVVGIDHLLQPASALLQADTKLFHTSLRQCIWNFFALQLGLSGSAMNNRHLLAVLEQKKIVPESRATIDAILRQCDTAIFTGVAMETDKKDLLEQTKQVLEKIADSLHQA